MGGSNPVGDAHRDWTGVKKQAGAAGAAAIDAEREAREQRRLLIAQADKSGQQTMDFAKASPQELRAYEQSLGAAETQLGHDQRLLDAIDPSVMEASQQILGLLRGTSQSGVMAPFAAQRDQQRNQVINQLRQRFGPGGESTQAGMKALRDFDMNANMQTAQVQQGSLNNLMGFLDHRPTMANSFGMLSQSGQNFGGIQNRLTNASMQTGQQMLSAMMGGNQGVTQTVGSQYAGDLILGRGQQQDHKTGVEFMGSMAGMMGGGGGKKGGGSAPDMGGGGGDNSGVNYFNQKNPYE